MKRKKKPSSFARLESIIADLGLNMIFIEHAAAWRKLADERAVRIAVLDGERIFWKTLTFAIIFFIVGGLVINLAPEIFDGLQNAHKYLRELIR